MTRALHFPYGRVPGLICLRIIVYVCLFTFKPHCGNKLCRNLKLVTGRNLFFSRRWETAINEKPKNPSLIMTSKAMKSTRYMKSTGLCFRRLLCCSLRPSLELSRVTGRNNKQRQRWEKEMNNQSYEMSAPLVM